MVKVSNQKTERYTLKVDAWQLMAIQKALEAFKDTGSMECQSGDILLDHVQTAWEHPQTVFGYIEY